MKEGRYQPGTGMSMIIVLGGRGYTLHGDKWIKIFRRVGQVDVEVSISDGLALTSAEIDDHEASALTCCPTATATMIGKDVVLGRLLWKNACVADAISQGWLRGRPTITEKGWGRLKELIDAGFTPEVPARTADMDAATRTTTAWD